MKYLKLFENYFPDNEPTTEELKQMFFKELTSQEKAKKDAEAKAKKEAEAKAKKEKSADEFVQSNEIKIKNELGNTFIIIKSGRNIDCEIFYNEETGDYEIEFLGRTFVFNEDTIEGLAHFILENY